jgi:integrase
MGADDELRGVDEEWAGMLFPAASKRWMKLRRQDTKLKPRAHDATQGCLDAMEKFFFNLRLDAITSGHVRGYQLARMHNLMRSDGQELHPWHFPAGHSLINHEISALAQMMRHAKLWQLISPFYFPLHVKGWSPRTILSETEEEHLFDVASRHPEAGLAYWVALISNHTSASGIELRGLRLGNLFLPAEGIAEIYIPEDAVKNTSRPRKLPLNKTARWAIEQCYKRALQLGCWEPEHYLFPMRVLNKFDPTRQASRSWLRHSWENLREATGFHNLKPHDLRHHCITRLLENDVNPETVIAIAGHVGRKMLEYYAHQRTRVKYEAVLKIENPKKIPTSTRPRNRMTGSGD